ncbi:MAG: hypothetical protein KL863_07840 [Rhizobium sp.]|nr:hypothetical protein [Rhizobium sp.]
MPFLGLLLMVAAGAAVWWWRLKMVKEAGSEIIDSVERMRGAYKRRQFRKAAEAAPLASIQNPAIAAVVFFLVLANEKPMQKDIAKEIVRERMKDIIHVSDMDEVMVFADWTAGSVVNVDDPVRRFRDLWLTSLDEIERRQLIAIAEEIAVMGGEPTPQQADAIQRLKRSLLN